MSFFVYDIIFLSAFILFLIIFLYARRRRIERQGLLVLYHTQVGVKFIDNFSRKYKKILFSAKNLVIGTGYVLMVAMIYLLARMVYIFSKPEFVKLIKIPPITPLIPYLPEIFKISFLPPFYFTYWIIVIAIIAVGHEFAHGIYARLAGIRVKSTGFGFLGPFLAAFVEPDEKKMEKAKKKDQLSILCAGTFANVIMAIIFYFVIMIFFVSSFSSSGVIFAGYPVSEVNIASINQIGNVTISNISEISFIINQTSPDIVIGNTSYITIICENKYYLLDKNATITSSKVEARAIIDGIIIEMDGIKIDNYEDFEKEILSKEAGQTINIKVENESILSYDIKVTSNPKDSSVQESLITKIINKLTFFKQPYTNYIPKYNHDLAWFIYYLLWWIITINLSVALVNMLPLGIFDGGRVFYVTMLGLLKTKKRATLAYKIATAILLSMVIFMMVLWAIGIV